MVADGEMARSPRRISAHRRSRSRSRELVRLKNQLSAKDNIMPLSAAERQKRYRERIKTNDPEKWKEIQEKNLIRAKKFYKKIGELSDEEKENKRKYWRLLKKKCDNKQEVVEKCETRTKYQRKYQKKFRKLTKENKNLKNKLELLIKENKALKKKIYRYKILQNIREEKENKMNDCSDSEISTTLSPHSITSSFVEKLNVTTEERKKISKELLEKNVLLESMKNRYKNAKNNKERKILKEVISSDIVKKYKMKSKFHSAIGLKNPIRSSVKKYIIRNKELASKVAAFFNQDDVSRATAGKKETKTKAKVKIQRRYLLDSMKKLRFKFIRDTGIPISYPTFRRLKPFYVMIPNISNRDTCLCKRHNNMEFKFSSLKSLKVFNDKDTLDNIIKSTVCDTKSQECMYSTCDVCKGKFVEYDLLNKHLNETVSWLEWTVKTIEYEKKNEKKSTKKTVKEIKCGTLQYLLTSFEKELKEFKIHTYNIFHQYRAYKTLKDNLQRNEIIIHCDFSENYNCKLHNEIQAVHFGASHSQITLHTSIIYSKDEAPKTFCTFSNINKHTPESIWAHLRPLLLDVKAKSQYIDTVHFFSDGPSSQYRQKKNFGLLSTIFKDHGFTKATWNFFEAAHGKGAADGVGGVIKRQLDKKVSYGHDVPDAETAIQLLTNDTTVKLYLITDEDIKNVERKIEGYNFIPIPNTLKVHQVIPKEDNFIDYRILSCFCTKDRFCQCLSIKKHQLTRDQKRVKRSAEKLSPEIKDRSQRRRKRPIIKSSSEDEDDDSVDKHKNKMAKLPSDEKQKCNKGASTSKSVTLLSNVKVNFKPKDLQKLIKKPTKIYNISSSNLKIDFKELFDNKENKNNNN